MAKKNKKTAKSNPLKVLHSDMLVAIKACKDINKRATDMLPELKKGKTGESKMLDSYIETTQDIIDSSDRILKVDKTFNKRRPMDEYVEVLNRSIVLNMAFTDLITSMTEQVSAGIKKQDTPIETVSKEVTEERMKEF